MPITPLRSLLTLAICAAAGPLCADSIPVPGFSFESPTVPASSPYATTHVDSWQKAPKPAYFDETAFGLYWDQTAGAFLDNFTGNPDPLDNRVGNQCAFILGFPGAALFQDYNSTDWHNLPPTHAFDATYEAGKSYQLTVGLVGRSMPDGTTLGLQLYYRDDLDAMVTIGFTPVVYSAAAFPLTTHLYDYSVDVPEVQPTDAWAGKKIGIELIEFTSGATQSGVGYWDIDNVRLTSAPEPSSLGLLALGGLALLRRRSRARA